MSDHMRPRVSIIIPTFNRALTLKRSIDSVLRQGYSNLVIVVVNDGSTDATEEVLARYRSDSRLTVVRHDVNRGVTAALNSGLSAMPPDTVIFGRHDSDDMLEPGAIDRLVTVFEETGDTYSQVFGWCRRMDGGGDTGTMHHREGPVTYDDVLSGRLAGEFWQLVRSSLLGVMRFDERASGGESSVWWRLLRLRPGWLVPDVVRLVDTAGDDRVTLPRYDREGATGRLWALRAGLVDPIGPDMRARYPRGYGALMTEQAKWAALAGDRRGAASAAREGLRYAASPRAALTVALVLMPAGVVRRIVRLKRSTSTAPPALSNG